MTSSSDYAKGVKAGIEAAKGEANMKALEDILAERRRQIEAEGWTPEHDDEHSDRELAQAAACYAFHAGHSEDRGYDKAPASDYWPWSRKWWKPKDRRRDLVRAGALILAEIERLDRALKEYGE